MKTLRVGASYYLNADSIQIIQPWPSRGAARLRAQATAEGRFHDATRGMPTRSLVLLASGWVVASPYRPGVLARRPLAGAPAALPSHPDGGRQVALEPVVPGVFVDPDEEEEEAGTGEAGAGLGDLSGLDAGDVADGPAPRRPFPPWWIGRS